MFTILLAWVYVTALCAGIGWVSIRLMKGALHDFSGVMPWSIYPFVGISLISASTAFISLLFPIHSYWNALYILILTIGIIRYRHDLFTDLAAFKQNVQSRRLSVIFLLGCASVLLLKCSIPIDCYGMGESMFHSDTGYYHAQSIRWIEEYGAVPGLGNLLSPLAIDYLWFQPCALFGFADILPHRMHAMTGLLVLWTLVYAAGGLANLLFNGSKTTFSNIYRSLLFLPLIEVGNYIVSDSGDEPTALMTLVSIGMAIDAVEHSREPSVHDGEQVTHSAPLLCCAILILAFTVAIKLSALPLMLLALLLILPWVALREWRSVLIALGLIFFVIVPKLMRSVILSGYLIYPLAALNFFNVDWKMPAAVLINEKAVVASMARIRFDEPGIVLHGGMDFWFVSWLHKLTHTTVGFCFLAASLLFFFSLIFFRKSTVGIIAGFWKIYLTLALGALYWFVMAPDVRFGYGFLASSAIVMVATAVFSLFHWFTIPHSVKRVGWLPVFILAVGYIAAMLYTVPRPMPGDSFGRGVCVLDYYPRKIKSIFNKTTPLASYIYQAPYPMPEMLHLKLGNLEINRPKRYMHCWDMPLPATPYLYSRIEARGSELKHGFRVCDGSVEGFSGSRIAEEWKETQLQSKKETEK